MGGRGTMVPGPRGASTGSVRVHPPSEPTPGSAGEGFGGAVEVDAGLSGLMALFEAFTLVLLWTNGLWD